MKRALFLLALLIATHAYAEELNANTKRSIVFISRYDKDGDWLGWGSGFFVDEGTVVTNRHVIEGAAKYYRIFATGEDDKVDLTCYKDITRSDIKINLEDDVAYIRVYLSCDHGIVHFVDTDPLIGQQLGVIGYPDQGSVLESLNLTYTAGVVSGKTSGPWLKTDAYMHFGNSGGPVVQEGRVIGVAVAKSTTLDGEYVTGYFIPMSIVRAGLNYANNSTFGYTPQEQQKTTAYASSSSSSRITIADANQADDPFNPQIEGSTATNGECFQSLGQGGEATGYGGCRCKRSYHKDETGTKCLAGAVGYIDPYAGISTRQRSTVAQTSSALSTAPHAFIDFDATDEGFSQVAALQDAGVIKGYPDGSFRPQGDINRAELLKILMEGFFGKEVRREENCFPDVRDEWFAPYVCAAKRLGWIAGYSDGTFRPANALNRAEGIKIIMEAIGGSGGGVVTLPRDVQSDSWFAPYVRTGLLHNILEQSTAFFPAKNLTRKDAAVWIYNGKY